MDFNNNESLSEEEESDNIEEMSTNEVCLVRKHNSLIDKITI